MRVGILGGTFDPVHRGHLHIAMAALREAGLDQVLFLPTGDPPHKAPRACGEDRLQMLKLATANEARFKVSDMELRRPGPSYTIDTLREYKALYPADEIFYIIGADTLFQLRGWRSPDQVAALCEMLVFPRPGFEPSALKKEQALLSELYRLQSRLIQSPCLELSSSHVRQAVKKGEALIALVPPAVEAYILKNRLYLDGA